MSWRTTDKRVLGRVACVLGVLAGLVCGQVGELRTWTARDGRTLQGALVSVAEGKVRIKRADGKEFDLALESLSDADQQLARDFARRAPKPIAGGVLAGYDPSKADFTSQWPRDVTVPADTEITVIEENDETRRYVYESVHFRFESDAKLRSLLVSKLATMFEAAFAAHREVPLGNRRTRATGTGKFKAILFEKEEDYHKAGGPANSAGVYLGRTDTFMVPLENLGVRKSGNSYTYDAKGDFHTLFHEITHQLWADYGPMAGTWMVEGFAEYMALMPFRGNRITLTQGRQEVPDFATAYGRDGGGGRALGEAIKMPRLERFMAMDQPEFYKNMNFNYACGLLLFYYFAEQDGGPGGKQLRECFKAMHNGASEEEARKVLLKGRSYEQLEREFAAGMHRVGIKVSFQ